MSYTTLNTSERAIIKSALMFYANPLEFSVLWKDAPFPQHIQVILQIAGESSSNAELQLLANTFYVDTVHLLRAIRFMVQQICLRETDPLRVLALNPTDSKDQLRLHYRLMMRFLHPDKQIDWDFIDIYTHKVTSSYNQLKDLEFPQTQKNIKLSSNTSYSLKRKLILLNKKENNIFNYFVFTVSFIVILLLITQSNNQQYDHQAYTSVQNESYQKTNKTQTKNNNMTTPTQNAEHLLIQFSTHYQNGDIEKILSLFSENASINGAKGKNEITDKYQKIFNTYSWRKLMFDRFNWKSDQQQVTGQGDLLVWTTEKKSNDTTYIESPCFLEITITDNQAKISLLHCIRFGFQKELPI